MFAFVTDRTESCCLSIMLHLAHLNAKQSPITISSFSQYVLSHNKNRVGITTRSFLHTDRNTLDYDFDRAKGYTRTSRQCQTHLIRPDPPLHLPSSAFRPTQPLFRAYSIKIEDLHVKCEFGLCTRKVET
jgi:hypothetical protein